MKKFLIIIIAIFAIFVQSSAQVLLTPDKYIWEYSGKTADTVTAAAPVWQKYIAVNKIDGLYYNARVKLDSIAAGAACRVVMQGKFFESDSFTAIDSVAWTGIAIGADTTLTFTHNATKQYYRYYNFLVRLTAGAVWVNEIEFSLKK